MQTTVTPSVGIRRTRDSRSIRPRPISAEILVCGKAGCGDDGVGPVVAAALRDRLPADVRLRLVGRLEVDDLLLVPRGANVVVVDAATGIRGGRIARLPIDGLVDRADGLRSRSAQALAYREVLGVAEVIRGRPFHGVIVAVGGVRFGPDVELSPSVRRAVPAMVEAVLAACAA